MRYKYSTGSMDKADGIYFQNMTWRQVEERLKKNDIIIIPVGCTENHGKGQCFGEDTFIVTRIAETVAKETGCTVSQPIWFGSHPWNQVGQPGTVIVPDEVFIPYLMSVIAGYWNAGFRKQILLNGHGQEYVIPLAIQAFWKQYQVPAIICMVNWPTVVANELKDKAHGGPWDTPFRHADEVEASISLALFPEMNEPEHMEDSEPWGFMPEGHVDKGGDIYQYPIPGHAQVGMGGLELMVYPQGVIGKPSLARAEKAYNAVDKIIDYLIKLHNDILERFPPGKLPDAKYLTERDEKEVEALLKGPRRGGKSLYSLGLPRF